MGASSRFDIDWQRLARWCLLGTIVMLLWLLAPVAKCSWAAFRDTPIGDVEEQADNERAPGQADKERVLEGAGFFSRWGSAMKGCYAQTPLFGHESWKGKLLIGFGALTVLGWSIGWYERRGKRTIGR
ncbi:MAG TPA: hypothetical protein VIV40_27335 [Kofleriaceae bacterium]